MQKNNSFWLGVGILIALLVAGGLYFLQVRSTPSTLSATSTPVAASTSTQGGTIQIGAVADTSNLKQPDLNRPYTPPANLSASAQAASKKGAADAITQLKIDPNHIGYWLQLALYRKGAADYVGAEDIWVYCTKRWPTDPISYNNLADLYENYIHDYAKAVTYWNKLIVLQPDNISAYVNLATMYNTNMKDLADARATVEAGLKANPNNSTLLALQEQLK